MAQLAANYSILKAFWPIYFSNQLLAQILRHSKISSMIIFCDKFMEVKPVMKTIRNGRAGGMPDFGISKRPYQGFDW
jgi:hypothetical protein